MCFGLRCSAVDTVHIELKNGTDAERETKTQLEQLLKSYDLAAYTFTHEVVIDEHSIPHSHPVLTLHTRHLTSDDLLLSTYLHEQLHWYLSGHPNQTQAAESDLRKMYPQVPVGGKDGAQNEESSYLHLIDCYLEMQADRAVMGPQRTADVMKFWSGDHYRWIYRTVIEDEARIADVLAKEHLGLPLTH
jgi:hypothetical protein